ncbi:MAG: hypothetical protein QGH39_04930 [Candidatus Thermoplasmatota archaeon]|jgi:hypothetical protein|nr:hypothetical protein [Candidatus Thermoplasmatota archaeon]MDP7264888.1 hypothetical protein [Candidatus Thermoplasmatota archaeon]
MSSGKLYPIVGSPATGKAFFDRKEKIKEIWEALKTGSVLFLGPRRFGKTSIMLNLREKPNPGWTVFYMDTEWIDDPTMFIADMFTKALSSPTLRDKVHKIVNKDSNKEILGILESLASGKLGTSEAKFAIHKQVMNEWLRKGQFFIKTINDSQKEGSKILYILDEVPWMLSSMLKKCGADEIRQFLSWFRALRHTTEGMRNIRFLISGSIGLNHILREAEAVSTVNDLRTISIEGFGKEKGLVFTRELIRANNFKCSDDVVDSILNIIGIPVHPFFVQLLVSFLANEIRDRDLKEPSVEDVGTVYWSRVLGLEGKIYFDHYYQRLFSYYSPLEADGAREILAHLSVNPELTKRQVFEIFHRIAGDTDIKPNKLREAFERMMDDLMNDFYLEYDRANDCYRFRYKILQDWWGQQHPAFDFQI